MSLLPSNPSPRRVFLARCGTAAAIGLALPFRAWTREEFDVPTTWGMKSWQGWMTVDGEPVPSAWELSEGAIHLKSAPERTGHIVTRQEYGDFEMRFEWKIAPGGNSGIKYRVKSYGDRMLGCEYQMYDAPDRDVEPKTRTGSLYGLYEPAVDGVSKPAGEWNQGRIRVQGDCIEHWLNGRRLVSATVGDPEWERRVGESKFNDAQDFGKNRLGRIMLTDHGSEVWFRNLEFQSF